MAVPDTAASSRAPALGTSQQLHLVLTVTLRGHSHTSVLLSTYYVPDTRKGAQSSQTQRERHRAYPHLVDGKTGAEEGAVTL